MEKESPDGMKVLTFDNLVMAMDTFLEEMYPMFPSAL